MANCYHTTLIAFLGIFIGLSNIGCHENRTEILHNYQKFHNEKNIESCLALYHEDIIFELKGTWTKKGLSKMRELADFDAAVNSHLVFESIQINGDTLICRIKEENDWFKAAGIPILIHDPTIFVIKDDKISQIIATPDLETSAKVENVIQSIFEYASSSGDTTIHELIKEGQFVYSKEAATLWMELFDRVSNYKKSI